MTWRVTATSDPWLRTRDALTVRASGVALASWRVAVPVCVRAVVFAAGRVLVRCVAVVVVAVVAVVSAAEAEAHVPMDENTV
ncbi:hypothetical protein [Novacetimonas maltaceti]|uniref:hypothetical protein n=1 Tax=Novacetimonas maltaceti TaxID=1203393 RepID=UPI001EF134EE|nr:hypothetical protein [Novacetimonas maltaceti]